MTPKPIDQARRCKANARKQKNRKAAKKRRALTKPYQSASRPEMRRVRANRKAERFDVDEGRGWIIVRAESGRYRECAEGLRSAGCPVFEARREIRTTTSGRTRVSNPPMLGRLLFVGVEESEQACILAALPYVEATFCRGEGVWIWADEAGVQDAAPAMIRPLMMKKFADHITGHLKADRMVGEFIQTLFEVGEGVRITDGAFLSYNGRIEGIEAAKALYSVAVTIFGRETLIDLEEKQMEAA